MWKYVSRRVKDTFEKTYNVLDRSSWRSCGSGCDPSNQQLSKQPPNQLLWNLPGWRDAPLESVPKSKGGYSSGQEKFRERVHPNNHRTIHNSWLGAITWSSAIICGWYASQLLCLHQRHLGWPNRNKCKFSHVLLSSSRALHSSVLAKVAFASPIEQVGNGRRAIAAERAAFIEDDFEAKKYTHNINNEFGQAKDIDVVDGPIPKSSSSVEAAVNNLLSVVGDIEYRLAIQNLMVKDYPTAVSHLKLGSRHHHAGATFNLGICYEEGLGVERDLYRARTCYSLAASLGHPQAMYNMGVFHVQGLGGLTKNRDAAKECFLVAANRGVAEARSAMRLFSKNVGTQVNKHDVPRKSSQLA